MTSYTFYKSCAIFSAKYVDKSAVILLYMAIKNTEKLKVSV